jgi:acetylglutamate kinase
VNADLAASALAAELKASKLVYLSDVLGLMKDPSDESTLIHSLKADEVEGLIADGTISGGMIPKVRSSVEALNAGVGKVHMIDGSISHSLLLEIFHHRRDRHRNCEMKNSLPLPPSGGMRNFCADLN